MTEIKVKKTPSEPVLNFYEFLEAIKVKGVLRKAYLRCFEAHQSEIKTLKEWKKLAGIN